MAEKTLQKVEAELTTCSICLDIYTKPKLLQCFHVYCQGCLARLVFRDQQGQLVLSCPDCRQVTPVPTGRVAGLQSAFHINHLLGIMEEHKKGKDESAQTENSVLSNSTQDKSYFICPEHADEELKLYCETCGKLICLKCVIKGAEHHDHRYELVKKAFEKYKNEIYVALEPVENQMATVKKAVDELDSCHEQITSQQVSIEANIHSSIGRLQEILEIRKTQLIGQLHKVIQSKLKSLAAQKDQLEIIQTQLGSCHDFMKKSIESDSHGDVLKMKTKIVNQVTELTAFVQPDLLKPCAKADLLYSESSDIIAKCQSYGQLLGPSIPDPSQCYATGNGLDAADVREKAAVTFYAVNYKNEACVEPILSLECELISELSDRRVLGRVERIEKSMYEISYQPTVKGRHSLHIKVEGQHIKGSPFRVAAKSSIELLGDCIGSIEVNGAWDVALTQNRKLIISGFGSHCVHVFSPNGKKLQSVGSRGSHPGQFLFPTGVAADKHGNIVAVDGANHRVQMLRAAGGLFSKAVGSKGSKKFQFCDPFGIDIDTKNSKVYVADTGNSRVQVFTMDIRAFSSFGSYGNGNGQFNCPKDVAYDSARKVLYVTDQLNNRVQVFTGDGKFLRMFGKAGEGEGELSCPIGVAVDSNGMVYVSEDGNHRISVFTSEGHFVKCFDGNETIKSPRGLAVDDTGVVYVCDRNSNCVQMF